MGLDISYYGKLAPEPNPAVDEDGYPEEDDVLRVWDLAEQDETWPGRAAGIAPGYYRYQICEGFRAGSYSGYNQWREWLSTLADEDGRDGLFDELINFSDCEGFIGPEVSRKLAADFTDPVIVARVAVLTGEDAEWFAAKYHDWRKAFETAADGGCVYFH